MDSLFRLQSGKMVAFLVRFLGYRHLEVAEEIVQETLLRALQLWTAQGLPPAPEAWLMKAARNRAIDFLRSRRRTVSLASDPVTTDEAGLDPGKIRDDVLRLMFSCCDPRVAAPDQVALTLHFVCGLSTKEIATALLLGEEAIRKRLFRAQGFLKKTGGLTIASWADAPGERLEAVLHVVYLLFNEGYQSTGGQPVVRFDLCGEALRLGVELVESAPGRRPQTHGLMALMCFQAARLVSRTHGGSLLSLEDQDRTAWDPLLIRRGFAHLEKSAAGTDLTRFHLEAAIAACHCSAPTFTQTDWTAICRLYDLLAARDDSPVVRLNRAVARGYRDGPRVALQELERLREGGGLDGYHLLDSSFGEFLFQSAQWDQAAAAFDRAIQLCRSPEEREYLEKKRQRCL